MANIQEEIIDLNEVQDIGGVAGLRVDDIESTFTAKVLSATAKKTQWGNRVDYYVEGSDGYGHIVSSWIFVSKKKFKPSELINKVIKLSPYNEKKLLLELVE